MLTHDSLVSGQWFELFDMISILCGIYVICAMISDGIEYQHYIFFNMYVMVDHVSHSLFGLSGAKFFVGFVGNNKFRT